MDDIGKYAVLVGYPTEKDPSEFDIYVGGSLRGKAEKLPEGTQTLPLTVNVLIDNKWSLLGSVCDVSDAIGLVVDAVKTANQS